MSRSMFLFVAIAACCFLAGCGGGGGNSGENGPASAPPAAAGQAIRSSIHSEQTGITYGFYVYLPPDYQSTKIAYPVIYATDSEYRYTTLTGALQQTHVNAILVNIDATSDARRWVDFTMPGATTYFRFLTQELIPLIESQYRSDPKQRILSGHSLSGEFAMYAMYLDPPGNRYFSSIISEEGSFWYQSDQQFFPHLASAAAMEQQMYGASHQLPVNLVMAGDVGGNEAYVNTLYEFLRDRGYEQLKLKSLVYGLGHVAMDGPAFSAALLFIFGSPPS